jgi:hypothetical protein
LDRAEGFQPLGFTRLPVGFRARRMFPRKIMMAAPDFPAAEEIVLANNQALGQPRRLR